MIDRILVGAVAVALVVVALITEPGGAKLSEQRTAASIAGHYKDGTRVSCRKEPGYWDYECRVRRPHEKPFAFDVRVNRRSIVEQSAR